MSKYLVGIVVCAVAILLAGCSKAPVEHMDRANQALEAARAAEADQYVPDLYRAAMDAFNDASAAKSAADGKFALFRSYKNSRTAFARAESLANEAIAQVQAQKEQVHTQVMEMLDRAQVVVDSARTALKKAPVGKGTKAEIELMKSDLAAATTALQDAQSDIQNEQYLVAQAKLEAAMEKARIILMDIAKAKGRKGA